MKHAMPFAPRGAYDAKLWRSLSHEQRAWVVELLKGDALAIEARESLGCAFAFELGRELAQAEAAPRVKLFGALAQVKA